MGENGSLDNAVTTLSEDLLVGANVDAREVQRALGFLVWAGDVGILTSPQIAVHLEQPTCSADGGRCHWSISVHEGEIVEAQELRECTRCRLCAWICC